MRSSLAADFSCVAKGSQRFSIGSMPCGQHESAWSGRSMEVEHVREVHLPPPCPLPDNMCNLYASEPHSAVSLAASKSARQEGASLNVPSLNAMH